MQGSISAFRRPLPAAIIVLAAALAFALFPQHSPAKKKQKPSEDITVMTRNLYLGADLGPALQSSGADSFTDANGAIARQVMATSTCLSPVSWNTMTARSFLKSMSNPAGVGLLPTERRCGFPI